MGSAAALSVAQPGTRTGGHCVLPNREPSLCSRVDDAHGRQASSTEPDLSRPFETSSDNVINKQAYEAIPSQVPALRSSTFALHLFADQREALEPWLSQRRWLLLILLGSVIPAVISILTRALFPVDETRYLAVAWEMWNRGNFVVPSLNGAPYDHKPPLLFWLIHAGWAVVGVNEWWPRILSPLCAISALLGLQQLAARLWPEKLQAGRLGTLMLMSCWYIAVYQTWLMFDMLLLAGVAWGWVALQRAAASGHWRYWAGYGLAIGLGLLAKGPVVLVYLLPPALAWRMWAVKQTGPRALKALLATVIALAVPGLWLASAIHAGSADYFGKLLMDQTLHRMHGQLGHPRPFYWYLPLLAVLPLPWLAWPRLWRHLFQLKMLRSDPGLRFVGLTAAIGFCALSLFSGKQVHYLIPLLALAFLWFGRALADPLVAQPLAPDTVSAPKNTKPAPDHLVLRISLASLAFLALLMVIIFSQIRPQYDLTAAGAYAGAQQRLGRPLAYVGKYQGELGFYGRLAQPVTALRPAAAAAWAASHPEGLIIARLKRLRLHGQPKPEFSQPYKSDRLLMFRADELLKNGSGFQEPVPERPLDGSRQ